MVEHLTNIVRIGGLVVLYGAYKLGLLTELFFVIVGGAIGAGLGNGVSLNGNQMASPIVGGVIGGLIVITILALNEAKESD